MKKFLKNLGLFLWVEALLISVLLFCVDLNAFYRPLYKDTYAEVGTAETIGVSETDLTYSTVALLDYLRDVRDDLDVPVTIDGTEQPMFNEREINHMVDVKVLYQDAMLVKWVSLTVFVVGLCAIFLTKPKQTADLFHKGASIALAVSFIVMIGLAIFALIDFTAFWTQFHLIFFNNDLWILNPKTDNLILMVPELFFNRLVTRILISFGIFMLALIASIFIHKRRKTDPKAASAE